ncbi:MAG: DUF1330 domain-containing protein [Gemmatimonadota bacterium]|nr:DUF1330 domain-containing protein [Gemmatimonadota bacterium]
MADAGVTLIANLSVHDAAGYKKYEQGFFPILKRHGGSFVTFDDKTETLEGETPPPGRIVLFRFPSEKAAKDWFADPEYQALSEHRRSSTTLHFLTLVHELPPRG